ncbi:MAG TPA: hypothetical protein DCG69_08860 [Bacteroidales bacterium]|nr:hypothetical protein [Bacteroidales bacterium]
MDSLVNKVFKGVSIVLIVVAAIYQIAVFLQGGSPSDSVLDGYFWVAYIAFFLAVVLAILFPIIQIIGNPKAAIRTLLGVVVLVILWFVAYALSDNTFSASELETMGTTADISKIVGAGLIYTYFVFAMAIVAVFYANIASIFK